MIQDIKNIYHLIIAFLANVYFFWPGKKLKVIGVTGTDGKTTTVNMIYHILKKSNKKVSMLSTLGAVINGKTYDTGFHVTTPSPFALQRLLNKAFIGGVEYFILEVTSHALDQNRVWGVPFVIGAVTNVTKEHLDYHKNYENYLSAKGKLLLSSRRSILNKEDKSYDTYSKYPIKFFSYGTRSGDLTLKQIKIPSFLDDFNILNALCASSVCLNLGLGKEEIENALKSFKLPLGRLDMVFDEDFKVVIDFAHTPNAFEKVLKNLRPKVKGKIIHVFGSAGKRDKSKRPLMGEISSRFSDLLILTSEDPRGEDAMSIISDIKTGIKTKSQVKEITNRKEAIEFAISQATQDDLVLITGKAHEKSMNYKGKEEPWDEYAVVKKALKI